MRIEPPTRTPRWACSNLNIDSPGRSLWPCHDGVRRMKPAMSGRVDTFHHVIDKPALPSPARVRMDEHQPLMKHEAPTPPQLELTIGLPPVVHEPPEAIAQGTSPRVVDPSLIPAGVLTNPVRDLDPRTATRPSHPLRWRVFHTVGILILLLVLEILIVRYVFG